MPGCVMIGGRRWGGQRMLCERLVMSVVVEEKSTKLSAVSSAAGSFDLPEETASAWALQVLVSCRNNEVFSDIVFIFI
jgi:hypothetical protein